MTDHDQQYLVELNLPPEAPQVKFDAESDVLATSRHFHLVEADGFVVLTHPSGRTTSLHGSLADIYVRHQLLNLVARRDRAELRSLISSVVKVDPWRVLLDGGLP